MQRPIRLMTVAPGHFHAALVQKRMVPGVHPRVHVYAPLDEDLLGHLARVAAFNARTDQPTAWELDVRASDDFFARMLREQPGNTVVLAGRNRPKIDRILAAVRNGLHVLADKPWVIEPDDFTKLLEVQQEADLRDVFVWDVMTERCEITSILQRDLMLDPDVFGSLYPGTPDEPALSLESVHYLKKQVDGRPLRRPLWWFDEAEAGHALADVGTHLADLAMWLLFPDRLIDYRRDLHVLEAAAWPTPLDQEQFEAITGQPVLPGDPTGGRLLYQGNGTVIYRLGDAHVRLTTIWDYEAAVGTGDTHEAIARGTAATVTVRHEPGGAQPELSVVAATPGGHVELVEAISHRCEVWQGWFPGVRAEDRQNRVQLIIPHALRTSHEDHFAEVVGTFVRHFHNPRHIPDWEASNLLAKYYLTTRAVELVRGKEEKI